MSQRGIKMFRKLLRGTKKTRNLDIIWKLVTCETSALSQIDHFHISTRLDRGTPENPIHHLVLLSDSREVLEASTVTLAPDRNWKAKVFPSLSSDFAENSAERDRERRDETDNTAYHDAGRQQR